MDGITHAHQSVIPDDPEADVGPDEWNAEHVVTGHFDIIASSTEPDTPPAASVRFFCQMAGTSPNLQVMVSIKLPNGESVPLFKVKI